MYRTFQDWVFPPACLRWGFFCFLSLEQDFCSHQICSTFCSFNVNVLIHGIVTVFPKSYQIILMMPNIIAWRWRKMRSSREEEYRGIYICSHLSQVTFGFSFCHRYSSLYHWTVPNTYMLFGLCVFSHSDNLPVQLFLIQHFCFLPVPFRPHCFELISLHIAMFQHPLGVLAVRGTVGCSQHCTNLKRMQRNHSSPAAGASMLINHPEISVAFKRRLNYSLETTDLWQILELLNAAFKI